jgi:hypothetical protein
MPPDEVFPGPRLGLGVVGEGGLAVLVVPIPMVVSDMNIQTRLMKI